MGVIFQNDANSREISFEKLSPHRGEMSLWTNRIPPNRPYCRVTSSFGKGAIRSTKGHRISTIKSRLLQLDGLYLRRFFEGRSEPPARIVYAAPPRPYETALRQVHPLTELISNPKETSSNCDISIYIRTYPLGGCRRLICINIWDGN